MYRTPEIILGSSNLSSNNIGLETIILAVPILLGFAGVLIKRKLKCQQKQQPKQQ